MFYWFTYNNLKCSVGNKSCSISGIFVRQPGNVVYSFYKCSCCAGRNTNVNTAQINSVFLIIAFPNFTCDITFSVSDMVNEINIILTPVHFYGTIATVFLFEGYVST